MSSSSSSPTLSSSPTTSSSSGICSENVTSTAWDNNDEINIFREYLRIPSVHPNIDYEPCVRFLRRQADSLDLPLRVYHPVGEAAGKPVVIITWLGAEPELPSILLNSHTDVVPVFEKNWTHAPFGAHIDAATGRIYARGSQDMKCVGTQYLAAIRELRFDGVRRLRRTVHVSFVPDEEIGGELGMEAFVQTADFAALNVGFALDEGIASPTDVFSVFYAERAIWYVQFHCRGPTGHGSLLHKNTCGEKVAFVLNKFLAFRETQVQRLETDPTLSIGDVTTINLTMIEGGVQMNVVPPLMNVSFDVRLAIDVSHDNFEKMIRDWCEEAGGGLEYELLKRSPWIQPTAIDHTNPYFGVFQKTIVDQLQLKIKTQVFPGGTDSRFIRKTGIPAIGFSPIDNTPVLLHDNDEFLSADTYLRGIQIYRELIRNLGNAAAAAVTA